MNRSMHLTICLAAMALLAAPLLAQQGPPQDQRPQQDPQGGPPMGGRGRGFGGPGPGGNGPMGRGGIVGQPPPNPELQKFEVLRAYIDTVDRLAKLANDPSAAGVAAVLSATDILRQRGPEAAINYLTKTLPDVKNAAVQRAIRIQLIDLYKQSGQPEKALEQLDALMKGA